MNEFEPNSVHTATIPITNNAVAGLEYTVNMYIGINNALCGSVNVYLAPGETRYVDMDVAMPNTDGTYPVYVGVLYDDILLEPLYQGENIIISTVKIQVVTSYGSVYIYESGGENIIRLGESDLALANPIPASDLSTFFPALKWEGINLPLLNPDGYNQIHFRAQYIPEFAVEYPYNDAPQWYTAMPIPLNGIINTTTFYRWYGGYWKPGVYSIRYQIGLCYFDQAYAAFTQMCEIKNSVLCTGQGSFATD